MACFGHNEEDMNDDIAGGSAFDKIKSLSCVFVTEVS